MEPRNFTAKPAPCTALILDPCQVPKCHRLAPPRGVDDLNASRNSEGATVLFCYVRRWLDGSIISHGLVYRPAIKEKENPQNSIFISLFQRTHNAPPVMLTIQDHVSWYITIFLYKFDFYKVFL